MVGKWGGVGATRWQISVGMEGIIGLTTLTGERIETGCWGSKMGKIFLGANPGRKWLDEEQRANFCKFNIF